ncbi:hypothetical protein [Candidatus Symbiopectobacterium sp.]|nr:hypothetical protein [Candidatus Symbiopectobacterium sp.]
MNTRPAARAVAATRGPCFLHAKLPLCVAQQAFNCFLCMLPQRQFELGQ